MKEISKNRRVIYALIIVGAMILYAAGLSACSSKDTDAGAETSAAEVQSGTVSEGVDTPITITGYTDFTDSGESSYFLKEGDKVAVLAPSALPEKQMVEDVISGLKEWGYVPVEGKYVSVEERTLDECVEDLKWALSDPEIKAIVCVRGGHASCEVLDVFPLDLIKQGNKPIFGYSDISTYHSAWTVAGLQSAQCSIYDCVTGRYPKENIEATQNIIKGSIPSYECKGSKYDVQGSAEGRLIGGNLSTLTTVLNTDYNSTALDGPYILFIEELEENYEGLHRFLLLLDRQGVLENAQGIVFGEFTDRPLDCDTYSGDSRGGEFESVADMISRQFLADKNIPVAFGFPAGHGDVNYPLLMGANVKLDVGADSFSLEWNKKEN